MEEIKEVVSSIGMETDQSPPQLEEMNLVSLVEETRSRIIYSTDGGGGLLYVEETDPKKTDQSPLRSRRRRF